MPGDDATRSGGVADGFEAAEAGALVYVDERGRVIAAGERNRSAAAQYGTLAVVLGATNWLYWSMGGPLGLAVGGTLTLLILRQVTMARGLEQAMALLASEQLDAAEEKIRRLLRRALLARRLRARAEGALARIASLRGDYAAALVWQDAALAHAQGEQSKGSERRMLEYNRIVTLVNLDRLADARRA
jgi:hypothetical protein